MKSSELRGTGEVFRFTLVQTLKSKAYIVSVVFLLLTALLAAPLMQIIKGGAKNETKVESSKIETAYVCNELPFLPTGLEIRDVSRDPAFSGIKFELSSESFEDLSKKLEDEGSKCKNVIVHPYLGATGITVEIVRVGGSDITSEECDALGALLCENLDKYKKEFVGATEDQLKLLAYEYKVELNYLGEDGTLSPEEDTGISGGQFGIAYGLMFIVAMVCIMASTQVATAVVTDKSSRVVELLLTSVRPMALLLGKIIAMLVATIGQYVVLILAVVLSNKVTAVLFNAETTYLTSLIPKGVLSNLSAINIVLSIVMIALGLLFYATLAGMCGAMVSKMEELQETLKYFSILSIVGMYMAIGAIISMQGSSVYLYVKFCELFPLTSPLVTPGARIIGVCPISYAIIAIVLLVIVDFLLLRFAAGVYESLITNMGNPMKPKDVIGMMKTKRKGGAK